MIVCPHCGAQNAGDATTCVNCGTALVMATAGDDGGPADVLSPVADGPPDDGPPGGGALPPPRLLAQIQGLIPPEPIITTGLLAPGTEADWQRVEEVLQRIGPVAVAAMAPVPPAPPAPAPLPLAVPPTRSPSRPVWVGLALLIAILAGFAFPPDQPAPAPRRPGVEAAYALIEALPPGARVLLAWDYEPTTQGEMQLLAQPILSHLQDKRARLANMSLRPLGPAMAADAYALTAAWRPAFAQTMFRPRPTDFGFIPGDAAALQALALSPAGAASATAASLSRLEMAPGAGIEAFDLIVEFSAETTASREWIEQIASRWKTPLLVAASGAVGPALEPYVQSGQVSALMTGYPDALAYEDLVGQPGPASTQQFPQSLVHLLFVIIVLLGLARSLRRTP